MKRFFKDNGLSLVLVVLFAGCWLGQALAGVRQYNEEQREHGQAEVTLKEYLRTGDFLEATFENWESEFFQMAAFLILSASLVQRGAAESRKPDDQRSEDDEEDEPAAALAAGRVPADAPWPARRGGLVLALYKRSLSLTLLVLFLICFFLHGVTGLRKLNEEAAAHGGELMSLAGYMTSSHFWFESFQNWQSEFLSVAALVVLSIFLRQSGSPESKPVLAPHAQTGT